MRKILSKLVCITHLILFSVTTIICQTNGDKISCVETTESYKAPIIVVVKVKSANFHSGFLDGNGMTISYRPVKFELERVLKGKANHKDFWVAFPLLSNKSYMDMKNNSLSHEIFNKGNKLILILEEQNSFNFLSIKDRKKVKEKSLFDIYRFDCSLLANTEANLSFIESKINQQNSK